MPGSFQIEVCLDSITSAKQARDAGIDRIELCSALSEGGLTPSLGMIKQIMNFIHLPIHAMIRPRGGDFCYSPVEYAIMKEDIVIAKSLGCKGVVFGILHNDYAVDIERTSVLVELAKPMTVTFHRAFDLTPDPLQALEDVIRTGAKRILSSGHAPTAMQGIPTLCSLIQQAGQRIIVMPGSGINDRNVLSLLQQTDAREIHLSAHAKCACDMLSPSSLSFNAPQFINEDNLNGLDSSLLRKIVELRC